MSAELVLSDVKSYESSKYSKVVFENQTLMNAGELD